MDEELLAPSGNQNFLGMLDNFEPVQPTIPNQQPLVPARSPVISEELPQQTFDFKTELQKAQSAKNKGTLFSGLADLGQNIIQNVSKGQGGNYQADPLAGKLIKELSNQPLSDLEQKVNTLGTSQKLEGTELQLQDKRIVTDPASDISKLARGIVKQRLKMDIPENISYSQLEKLIPGLKALMEKQGAGSNRLVKMKGAQLGEVTEDSRGNPINPHGLYEVSADGKTILPTVERQINTTDNQGSRVRLGEFSGGNLSGHFADENEDQITDIRDLKRTLVKRAPKELQRLNQIEKEFNFDVEDDIKSLRAASQVEKLIEKGIKNPAARTVAGAEARRIFEGGGVATDQDVVRYINVNGGINKVMGAFDNYVKGTFTTDQADLIKGAIAVAKKSKNDSINQRIKNYDEKANSSLTSANMAPGTFGNYLKQNIKQPEPEQQTVTVQFEDGTQAVLPKDKAAALKTGSPVKFKGVSRKVSKIVE